MYFVGVEDSLARYDYTIIRSSNSTASIQCNAAPRLFRAIPKTLSPLASSVYPPIHSLPPSHWAS